jgi:hypothetical protein
MIALSTLFQKHHHVTLKFLPRTRRIIGEGKRRIISLELRANDVRTGAIREAAHLAAGDDEGLEQGIVDACFSRRLYYEAAEEYADRVAKIIEETMGCRGQD